MVFRQVGRSSAASGEIESFGERASYVDGNSERQRSVQLPPDFSFELPPSILGGSASAYSGNLTFGMLHEIRARMANLERKDAERYQKAAVEILEMDRKKAESWPRSGERRRKL